MRAGMNAADCLEVIRRFDVRFRSYEFPPGPIFLSSLVRLLDWSETSRPVARCVQCRGWGITKRGPCAPCGSLGFIEKRSLKAA